MTKQGTPTSGSAGLSPATTRHGTTVAGAQAEKEPAWSDRCNSSDPGRRLEDYGCRP